MQYLTDEKAIVILAEFARIDPKALNLMIKLENAKEFGEQDMILGQIHYYVNEHSASLN